MTSNSSSSQNSLDQRLWRLSSVRASRSSFPFDPDSSARPRRTSHPFFLTGSLTFSPVVIFARTRALLSPPRVRQADTLAAAPPVVLVVIMCALSERSRASSGSTVRRSRACFVLSRVFACSSARACVRSRVTVCGVAGVSTRTRCRFVFDIGSRDDGRGARDVGIAGGVRYRVSRIS